MDVTSRTARRYQRATVQLPDGRHIYGWPPGTAPSRLLEHRLRDELAAQLHGITEASSRTAAPTSSPVTPCSRSSGARPGVTASARLSPTQRKSACPGDCTVRRHPPRRPPQALPQAARRPLPLQRRRHSAVVVGRPNLGPYLGPQPMAEHARTVTTTGLHPLSKRYVRRPRLGMCFLGCSRL